jgi:hypothetical protein
LGHAGNLAELPFEWVATDDVIVSGLAPGKLAETTMVGKSICGSGAIGSTGYEMTPAKRIAIMRSEVATGRRIKGVDRLMASSPVGTHC